MTGLGPGPLPGPPRDRLVDPSLFGPYADVARVALVALPLVALAVWALARRRRRSGATRSHAWLTALADAGLVYGTLPFVWITLLPGDEVGASGAVSLVPFRDLATMSSFQVVGNLAILAALGFLAPLRFAGLRSLGRVLLLAATCSTLIETAQHVLRLDRVSSVDDVLLNTLGAGVAAVASSPWWRARRSVPVERLAPVAGG